MTLGRMFIAGMMMSLLLAGCGSDATPVRPGAMATADPTPTPAYPPHEAEVMRLGRGSALRTAWSPDGETLAVAGSLGVWLYDVSDLEAEPRLIEGYGGVMIDVAYSPDGGTIASTSQDGTTKFWRMPAGAKSFNMLEHEEAVTGMAYSPDGETLATTTESGRVYVWERAASEPLMVMEGHKRLAMGISYSPDGAMLAAAASRKIIVPVWDVASGEELESVGSGARVPWAVTYWDVTYSPDGAVIAVASDDLLPSCGHWIPMIGR